MVIVNLCFKVMVAAEVALNGTIYYIGRVAYYQPSRDLFNVSLDIVKKTSVGLSSKKSTHFG